MSQVSNEKAGDDTDLRRELLVDDRRFAVAGNHLGMCDEPEVEGLAAMLPGRLEEAKP